MQKKDRPRIAQNLLECAAVAKQRWGAKAKTAPISQRCGQGAKCGINAKGRQKPSKCDQILTPFRGII